MIRSISAWLSALTVVSVLAGPAAQSSTTAVQDPAAGELKTAQQLVRDGKLDEALAICRNVLAASPDSFQANTQAGVALDLAGNYKEARAYFAKAIAAAQSPENTATARRAMAMSYAFEMDCKAAAPFETQLYDSYLAAKDFYNAGEIANELARVCIESGDLDTARKWYLAGRDAGLKEPDIKPERRDLWEFRTEHALARLAARRGDRSGAQQHVDAAKAIIDKGTNPTQAVFVPYLTGYVAFYLGDYQTALQDLKKANQNDPFILSLMAQTYEHLGDRAQAMELYRKVLTIYVHNPTGAFSRPLARKKAGG
jgi:tetratricopeptide (TPR) repeat protein